MDLPKRLNLSNSILEAAQEILNKNKEPVVEETLNEFSSGDPTTPNAAVATVRNRLATSSRRWGIARRVVGGVAGTVAGIALDPSETDNNDEQMRGINDRWNAMSPDERAAHRRENGIPEPDASPEPQAQTQVQAQPERRQETPSNDGPSNLPTPPPQAPEPRAERPARPTRTAADDSSDRLNAISLGQSVADRGGTSDADATPRNSGEEDAANNMRRRRREIASEEVIHPRAKKKKLVNPQIEFNPDTKDVNEAVVTKGKIQSSKRITKALQDIMSKGQAKEYKFEDGTTVKIEPAMARIALNKYNAMSDFEKASAAKVMRNSYKEFLTSIR